MKCNLHLHCVDQIVKVKVNVDIKFFFFFFPTLTGGDIYETDTYEILKNFLVLFIYSSVTWEWGGWGIFTVLMQNLRVTYIEQQTIVQISLS